MINSCNRRKIELNYDQIVAMYTIESGAMMDKELSELQLFFDKRKKYGIKPGLERINKLLYLVDNPEKEMKAIHIAGTNGKGSTLSYLKNALLKNGYKVGIFTSPSLEGITGHILRNNEKIPSRIFKLLLDQIAPMIQLLDDEENHPTEFEIITVIAYLYFKDYVDIALIEAGMGGKEDTTNCFMPILSIITNVDLDHTAYLGNTIEEVASHKAGIIKKSVPIITGETKETALRVIREEATGKKAPIYELHKQFNYTQIKTLSKCQHAHFEFKGEEYPLHLKSFGEHQVKNATVALMALKLLNENGFLLNIEEVLKGINGTQVAGRFEIMRNEPTIIIDAAHNPAGIKAFIQAVETNYTNRSKHLLFAAFKDKDTEKMLHSLLPYFEKITITTFDHPRAFGHEELLLLENQFSVSYQSNWKEVIENVVVNSRREEVYFITGSMHFIGMVRQYLINESVQF